MPTLKLAAVVALSAAVFAALTAVVVLAAPPLRAVGSRARKRAMCLERDDTYRMLEPALVWIGARIDPFLSVTLRQSIERSLVLGGDYNGLVPAEVAAFVVLGGLAGGAAGLLLGAAGGNAALFAVLLSGMGGALVPIRVREAARDRQKLVTRHLPAVIDKLALGVSAGLDFPAAVRQVVDGAPDPLEPTVDELSRLLAELQLGRTRKEALAELALRVPAPAVTEFVAALVQADEKGNPVIDALLVQADVARTRRSVRAEETASRAGVAMTGPLFLMFACTMLLVIAPLLLSVPGLVQ